MVNIQFCMRLALKKKSRLFCDLAVVRIYIILEKSPAGFCPAGINFCWSVFMKKVMAVMACVFGLSAFCVAQEKIDWKNYGAGIEEGDIIVRGDIGAGAHFKKLPYDGSMKIPYLEASVEYIKKLNDLPLGFGGFIGYSQDKMSESASYGVPDVPDYEWKGEMNYINLGALANYHIQLPVEKLDVYAGPVMSASRIAVLNPSLFTLQAKRLVTSDFPTPPLPETIPITFFTEEPE